MCCVDLCHKVTIIIIFVACFASAIPGVGTSNSSPWTSRPLGPRFPRNGRKMITTCCRKRSIRI
ncbi:uncharacterized protein K489DRAFT_377949 [Dissoconium aciculare CBS 342.82]|uniref:Uncharacterized protein n=1 Tax=Dissoconium aciculare CBS 342.82 TaxID=1314786 RepID=A0A6J3MBZ1_9PEZI|nr:uncharacterized protein K489DRAFT_377949 [Dissoconium aciculare CBS 342.82]KAF1825403.1 hypothetical protein K489DRAFT_377949 [Dissoconium aciculare CBS 342.82]